jgi:hemoglobin
MISVIDHYSILIHLATQNMKTDIKNLEDIKIIINTFYDEVRRHPLLAPVFASRITDEQWPAHLERMYAFWNAILFSETGFQGNPMQKHITLPINENHFHEWLSLFRKTVDESFAGTKAEEAKQRAMSIAQIMNLKLTANRSDK